MSIPILLYHSVSDAPPSAIRGFEATPAGFHDQLDRLVAGGCTSMTVSGLARALSGAATLPPRPAVITFDDGWADVAAAAPALIERGLVATLYVTTGWLGRPGVLGRSQLPELVAAGIEIGAHTHTHPELDTLPVSRARAEIAGPRDILQDIVQTEVASFAYPHGYSSPGVRRLVRDAGYTSAAAVKNALSSADDDIWELARLTVTAATSPARFDDWLSGLGAPVAPYPERLRTKGWRIYRRSRSKLKPPSTGMVPA